MSEVISIDVESVTEVLKDVDATVEALVEHLAAPPANLSPGPGAEIGRAMSLVVQARAAQLAAGVAEFGVDIEGALADFSETEFRIAQSLVELSFGALAGGPTAAGLGIAGSLLGEPTGPSGGDS